MRALVLEEFGRLAVQEMPEPTPGPGEVLIQVDLTGICGSDIHGFTGENGRRVPGQVMGHESEGRVATLGPGLESGPLRPGQRVTFNPVVVPEEELAQYAGREQHSPGKYVMGVRTDLVSSFAQFITIPARNVVALPEALPPGYGALIEPLAVAVHAVGRSSAQSESKVLVVGGGPIGQSVVLALRMAGIHDVLVSELDPARRALLERLGATPIDPRQSPIAATVVRMLGAPADVCIDAVGGRSTVNDALGATKLGGTVCLVGMGSPRLELDAYALSTAERSIVGSFTYSMNDFRRAAEWIATSPPLAQHLVSRVVQLEEADAAFRQLAAGDGTPGKVLVRLTS